MTLAEEDYLKSIYHLEQKNRDGVNTNSIAEDLNTRPSSVTDMIKKLDEKQLLIYKKYKGVLLTEKGAKVAASVIRKHRLWETFLVEKLHFKWDEVHDIAEQLEHIQSENLIERLDQFLNHPKVDPHGDPIPDKQGNFIRRKRTTLSNTALNEQVVCIGVKSSSSEFLKYLNEKNITIGTLIQPLEKTFDGSVEITINNAEKFAVSAFVADNLYVKGIE